MKYFLKTLITGLLVGMPLAVILIVFMYFENTNIEQPIKLLGENQSKIEGIEKLWKEESEQEYFANSTDGKISSTALLAFAGDVQFSEQSIEAYDKSGIEALVDEEMISYMQGMDLLMLNHEFAFSLRGEAMEEKQYTFRTDPKYVSILQELGTDVVTIANNHILDYGQDAFLDTLDTLEQAEISYVGGGHNYEEALEPSIHNVNGQTFAIFAATRVSPSGDWYAGKKHPGIIQTYDATEFNKAISEAEGQYDHTIVFVHWGLERIVYPEDYQRTLAKGYIDAGADLVIGCHPHVLQGIEYYKDVPIVYSLGNYLFGNRVDETALLQAEFSEENKLTLRLIPCKRVNGVLKRMEEPKKLFNYLTDISFGAGVTESGLIVDL